MRLFEPHFTMPSATQKPIGVLGAGPMDLYSLLRKLSSDISKMLESLILFTTFSLSGKGTLSLREILYSLLELSAYRIVPEPRAWNSWRVDQMRLPLLLIS